MDYCYLILTEMGPTELFLCGVNKENPFASFNIEATGCSMRSMKECAKDRECTGCSEIRSFRLVDTSSSVTENIQLQ